MILHGQLMLSTDQPPQRGWIAVESRAGAGRIVDLQPGDPPQPADLGDGSCLICPGFVDAHLHLPQLDIAGYDGMDLLDWLAKIVYPAESRWANGRIAADQVKRACARMVGSGTLGYAAFLTSHALGVGCVLDQTRALPLRCIIGQTIMDRNGPSDLTTQPPLPVRPVEHSRVTISCNPRFALACSETALQLAANLAGGYAPIQTHLAESKRECEAVAKLFASDPNYTSIYDRVGLLTERSLLAHCVHLTGPEWSLIAKRKAVVVHCPTANTFLQSGVFDLRAALEHNVRLALGSDFAAGPDLSMPRIARAMIDTAKLRAMTLDPAAYVPCPAETWELITRTNALALGWPDAGRIEIGAAADLLVLRVPFEIDAHLIARLIHTWDDNYIAHRIVNGMAVGAAAVAAR